MVCVYRAQQRGFFFALNQDREAADPALVEARLVQQLGVAQPLPPPNDATASVPAAHARWHGLYLSDPSRLQAMALPERLFGFWWLELRPGAPATLRQGLFGPVRSLHPAGPDLYRQADRQQATLALLQSADGRTLRLGGSYLTLRQEPLVRQALLWALALFGALGALSLLPLAAWRAWRHGWRGSLVRVPAALALLFVAAALSAWLLRGWQQLGEPGAAAVGLLLASLLLAAAAAWQAWRGWQAGHRPETWSAIGTLLFVGLCAGHGWWPVVAWRI
jgi:hypothetical protein